MNEKVFGSYDDIDAALDEEYGKDVATEPDDKTDEEPIEEVTEEETSEVSTDEVESKQDEVVVEKTTQEKEDEGKSESKKDHAFSDLRAENSNLRKERDDYKADSEYLKELAASYGYNDVSKFQEAIRQSRYQKEAQEKGYDPVLYQKTMEQERRIAELEKERDAQETQRRLERFKNALDSVVSVYEIDEKEIFSRLESAGISVDDILNVNNPRIILDGVLVDEIKNNAKQSQIKDLQNLNSLAEGDNEKSGGEVKITIDSLLKDDLAEYKRNNFIS